MEARRTRRRWSYAEFARLPSEGTSRQEVIDGELVVTPAPGLRHQGIVTDLVTLLNTFVRAHDLGRIFAAPVDVLFGEGDYLEPDIVFVRRDRTGILSDRGVEGPPDLVVEIVSPATADRDRGVKLERYRHFGVAEYWIVDPEVGALEVWALSEGASEPVVFGPADVLRWSPWVGGPVLEISVAEVLSGFF
jgi:Uma2 family endonuclease